MTKIVPPASSPDPLRRAGGFWSSLVRRTRLALIAMGLATAMPAGLAQQAQLAGPLPEGISKEAAAQIGALLADKESRSPAQQKIDSQLLYATKMSRRQAIAEGVPTLELTLPRATEDPGVVLVEFRATVSKALLDAVTSLGGKIMGSYPESETVLAWVSLESLETLAGRPDVRFVYPARAPKAFTGSVTSEGDKSFGAELARSVFPHNAAGLKIGVISTSASATGIARSVSTGDLASGQVTVIRSADGTLQDGVPGSDEGLAMMEIINDVCPGAQLFFATSTQSEAGFADNIRRLRSVYGCDIIVDDIIFYSELPFQDGIGARAVNDVTADGAIYFSAAVNYGSKANGTSSTWVGDFVDGGAVTIAPPGGNPAVNYRIHSFQTSPSVQNFNLLANGSISPALTLFWSDPENGSSNDYDFFLLNAAGTAVLNGSTNLQSGTQNAFESMASVSGNSLRLVVVQRIGAQARALHMTASSCATVNSSQLSISTAGFAHGHGIAANAISVGAVPSKTAWRPGAPLGPNPDFYSASQKTEPFTSDGPIRRFFNADGTAVTPGNFLIGTGGGTTAQYPILTAPDGVSTSVPNFQPFFGTSAAAPHAAAVAGLIKAYKPNLTAAQIRAAMVDTALDIEATGTDFLTGAGIVRPYNALKSVTLPPVIAVTYPAPGGSVSDLSAFAGTASDPNGVLLTQNPPGTAAIVFSLQHVATGQYWDSTAWVAQESLLLGPVAADGTWSRTSGLPTGANARLGAFRVRAVAQNVVDITSVAQPGVNDITFTVDNVPPTVTITSPADGSLITQSAYAFTGTANDDVGIDRVQPAIRRESDQAYWNGVGWTNQITLLAASYNGGNHTWAIASSLPTFSNGGLAPGAYTFIAVAFDTAGNSQSTSVSVRAETVYRWVGGTQSNPNDWGTAANWMPNGIPADNDVIQLDNGGRIDSTVNRTVRGLRLLNGSYNNFSITLTGPAGTSVWSGGTVENFLIVSPGAGLAINTSGTPYLHNATLVNAGSITITASDPNNPQFLNGANATLTNLSGGTISVLRDGLVLRNQGGTNLVSNQPNATFVKTADSAGISSFEWPLDNNGTVQADAGTMAWNAGSSSVGSTGTWKASVATARVQFSGGTHVLKGGTIFTGLGRVRVAGGTVSVSDLITLGASGSATGGFELTGGTIQGGTGSILNHLSGGTFAWSGGTLSVATVNISNGTVMAIDTSGSPSLSGCTLNSSALVTLTASDPNNPFYLNGSSSLLKNFAGGRIELGRDGRIFRNSGTQPILVNQGTIVKTAGTGTTDLGDWTLQNAANAYFGANVGTLSVGTPATFDQGTNLTGPGRVRIQTDVTLAGQVNVATETRFAGGTLTGNGFVKIGAGTLYWDAGTFTGTVTIAAGSTLAINTSSSPSLNNATLTNAGTVVMSASDPNNRFYLNGSNSTFNNQAGAVFQIANSSYLRNVGTPPSFANAGTVGLPTAATLSTDWTFSQSATGVLDLALTSATAYARFSSSTSVTLGGQMKVSRDPNYVPATGASFPVMSFASRSGAFATTVGLGLHNGYKLAPTLAATSVTLGVVRSSFGTWQDQKFGASANDPNIAGPYATPAGDGIPNVLKYAFGLDPFANGTSKLPKAGIVRDTANGNTPYLGISFRRLIGASDPIYVPRVSAALTGAWDDSGTNVTLFGTPAATGDGITELVTFRLTSPVTPGAQAFMDVLVDFE